MKNAKLSLADFKAKADKVETMEALDAVNGGGLFNCHGNLGKIGKAIVYEARYAFDRWLSKQ